MIVLSSITICLIVIIIISYALELEVLLTISSIILGLLIFIGWLVIGTAQEFSTKSEKAVVAEIIKGKHVAVVSTICEKTKDNTTTFTNNDIDYINDKTEFYWLISFNLYGYEIKRQLKFK